MPVAVVAAAAWAWAWPRLVELLRAGLVGNEGLVVGSAGESAEESADDLCCGTSSVSRSGASAFGLAGGFTRPSEAGSRLLSLLWKKHARGK